MLKFLERLFDAVNELGVQGIGIVAVSGGADSVALLVGLAELRRSGRLPEVPALVAAHLNHQLRGDESDADEDFAGELAARLEIEFASTRVDCSARGMNLEQEARRERYSWLGELAQSRGATWVATGHTADDQAETIIFRLLRGSGLTGLRGIAAERELIYGVRLIRPMLCLERCEGIAYLESIGQSHREDSTNADVRFTRNRIRAELMPTLLEYNPRLVETLGHLASQAADVTTLIDAMAADLFREAELPRDGAVCLLKRDPLVGASRHLVREVFRSLWQREGWLTGRMRFREWDALAGLALGEERVLELPGRIRAVRHRDVIRVEPSADV